MIDQTFSAELKGVLDTLAATEPELAALNRYVALTKGPRNSPAFIIQSEPQRIYRNSAILRVSITIESTAGDDGKPDPNNHASRVALANRLFLDEKADRIAAIAARGKLTVDDWGQITGPPKAADGDGTGEKLRTVLVLLVAARRV